MVEWQVTRKSSVRVQCCHFWCFNIRSDVLREISDVWCFVDKSDVDCVVAFFTNFLYFLGENELDSWLSSFFHQFFTLTYVWYSFQAEEALFITLGITHKLRTNNLFFHLMRILCFGFNVGYCTLLDIRNRSI